MIDVAELARLIQEAFDMYSDVEVDPATARQQQALKIAQTVSQFVVGRKTVVTGTSVSGGAVTGTGLIQ